jgi:glucosylceramidase
MRTVVGTLVSRAKSGQWVLRSVPLAGRGTEAGRRAGAGRWNSIRSKLGITLAASACVLGGSAVLAVAAAGTGSSRLRSGSAANRVAVYLTSGDAKQRLARMPGVRFAAGSGHGAENVVVNAGVSYQPLTAGFGVAMTDTSAWLLHNWLPARRRDQVMRRLFSLRAGGIGLAYLRVPIGGSDYVVHGPYTYDDLPAGQRDPQLRHFSLRHDRAYILPMIRQALSLNPALTIMANPWAPPAWMKTDDSIIPTGVTSSTLRPDGYGPLAEYLVKFLKGYAAAGVPVSQLGVANEPLNTYLTQSFAQMFVPPQAEGRLIQRYVGPALRRAHLHPRLLAWDYVYPKGVIINGTPYAAGYIPTVIHQARIYVKGLAFHCYFSDATAGTQFHRQYPKLPQFETECSSYLSDINPAQMAIRVLRNWAQGVQLWNAAVDQNLGPKIGQGCEGITGPHRGQQCIAPVIVDRTTHSYRLTSDYWELGQFSRFIRLGARRIDSTTPSNCVDGEALPAPPCGVEDVAFRNPDGSIVLVATTNDGKPHRIMVTERGRSFSYLLRNGDVATFVWRS